MRGEHAAVALLGSLFVFGAYLWLIGLVSSVVTEPYMDEVFHVGQTREYCQGRWDVWDDKITTPPGLYYAALALLSPPGWFLSAAEAEVLCSSLVGLRSLNALYASAAFLLLFWLFGRQGCGPLRAGLSALNGAFFPLLFQPSLLFYTDGLGLVAVVGMVGLGEAGLSVLAALLGLAALFVRQSNIVWVAFVAGLALERQCLRHVAARGPDWAAKRLERGETLSLPQLAQALLRAFERPAEGIELLSRVFGRLSAFAFVGLGFGIFAAANGGLALGDRSAHQLCLHLAQLCYFAAFTAGFGAPLLLSPSTPLRLLSQARRRPLLFLTLSLGLAVSAGAFAHAHPYLLADNRHLTFYFWKDWLGRGWWARAALGPAFAGAWALLAEAVGQQSAVWRLGFVVCAALATVPNRLLELRYFLVPFVLWRLRLRPQSFPRLLLETALFAAVNAATLYLFLYKPFRWPSEPHSWQRFMW